MRFLTSVAGVHSMYGTLTTYKHRGVVSSIANGKPWAADNCAFSNEFDGCKFLHWLETSMLPYQSTCLFVVVPDMVGDSGATLHLFDEYAPLLIDKWPIAYVAQDGSERFDIPECDALFIGGTTEWKESAHAVTMIKRAQCRCLHIHIGRVNTRRRYDMFRLLDGSNEFTCDGTKQRFVGVDNAHALFRGFESRTPLITL